LSDSHCIADLALAVAVFIGHIKHIDDDDDDDFLTDYLVQVYGDGIDEHTRMLMLRDAYNVWIS